MLTYDWQISGLAQFSKKRNFVHVRQASFSQNNIKFVASAIFKQIQRILPSIAFGNWNYLCSL